MALWLFKCVCFLGDFSSYVWFDGGGTPNSGDYTHFGVMLGYPQKYVCIWKFCQETQFCRRLWLLLQDLTQNALYVHHQEYPPLLLFRFALLCI
ncbi:hypothetical protein AAZV13_09G226400 [Glycine max]